MDKLDRDGRPGDRRFSRRTFVTDLFALTGALALPRVLDRVGWSENAIAADVELVEDTLNGLVAFIVPGPDAYSVAQGVSTTDAGGIDAGATPALIFGLNSLQEFQPTLAASAAALLNGVAQAVKPNPSSSSFASPFANLSFAEKTAVFAVLEGDPSFAPLRSLAGVLPAIVAFLAYSEVGVFDPRTRTLTGQPVGWTISGYDGVAEGRDELKGYFENRRKAYA